MNTMSDLSIEVDGNDIRVTKDGTPYAVTFRKAMSSPLLEADELLGNREILPDEAPFLAAAWRAAYAEAKSLGWL